MRPLIEELQKVKAKAKAAGVFTNDRELLECNDCGLQEDVLASGILVVVRESEPDVDTGMQFVETDDEHQMLCPQCGKRLAVTLLGLYRQNTGNDSVTRYGLLFK